MESLQADTPGPVATLIRSRQNLQANPENADALFQQGVALCQLGQWEQALESWDQVTHLEPGNVFAYLNCGIVYLQQEQWEAAEQAFESALRRCPEHPEAHFGLGVALAQQGRYESAHAAWQETLRLNPEHPEAEAHLSFLAQMSATEVESLNVGSAQTLQFDCIVASSALHTRHNSEGISEREEHGASEYNALEQEGAGFSEAADNRSATPQERRVKLPPMIGPNLDTIADAVVAAQETRKQAEVAVRGEVVDNVIPDAEAAKEPTLKLDSKALKREHARLKASDTSSYGHRRAFPGKLALLTGSVVVAAAGVMLWATLRPHTPVSDTSLAASSDANALPPQTPLLTPTIVKSSISALPQVSLSPTPAAKKRAPTVVPPPVIVESASMGADAAVRASAVHPSAARTRTHSISRDAAPRRKTIAKAAVPPASEPDAPRSSRNRRVSDSPAASPSAVRPTRHAAGRADEDTFAAHRRRPAHANADEEWTDRMPQ